MEIETLKKQLELRKKMLIDIIKLIDSEKESIKHAAYEARLLEVTSILNMLGGK